MNVKSARYAPRVWLAWGLQHAPSRIVEEDELEKDNEVEESSCHFLLKRTYDSEVQSDFGKVEGLELQLDG